MHTRKTDVAQAILGLSYIDMLDAAEQFVASIKSDLEDEIKFDPEDAMQWAHRLRWWAEGVMDAEGENK